MVIFVVGATSPVGRRVCQLLAKGPMRLRAVVRDVEGARRRLGQTARDIDLVCGDRTDAALIKPASAAFIDIGALRPSDETPVLEALAQADVRHLVKISRFGASADCPIDLGRVHFEIECHARKLGFATTFLRPGLLLDNLLNSVGRHIREGRLPSVVEDGRVAWVHPGDVAEAAASVLVDGPPQHVHAAYELTGPEPLSYDDLAGRLTEGLGRSIQHVRMNEDSYRSMLVGDGLPVTTANHLSRMYATAVRAGFFDVVTAALPDLLGRSATGIEAMIDIHASKGRYGTAGRPGVDRHLNA